MQLELFWVYTCYLGILWFSANWLVLFSGQIIAITDIPVILQNMKIWVAACLHFEIFWKYVSHQQINSSHSVKIYSLFSLLLLMMRGFLLLLRISSGLPFSCRLEKI
jgi:hypothetical protein